MSGHSPCIENKNFFYVENQGSILVCPVQCNQNVHLQQVWFTCGRLYGFFRVIIVYAEEVLSFTLRWLRSKVDTALTQLLYKSARRKKMISFLKSWHEYLPIKQKYTFACRFFRFAGKRKLYQECRLNIHSGIARHCRHLATYTPPPPHKKHKNILHINFH